MTTRQPVMLSRVLTHVDPTAYVQTNVLVNHQESDDDDTVTVPPDKRLKLEAALFTYSVHPLVRLGLWH
jgi:hypothetical protein